MSFFQIKQSSEFLVALPSLPVLFPNSHQTFRQFVVCVCVCLYVCVCYSEKCLWNVCVCVYAC